MQFIIIARDHQDSEALNRRLAARAEHIELGDELVEQNKALFGVALLDDDKNMKGSVYIMDFDSREELDAWLEQEPYVQQNVWDKIEVIPCVVGPSFLNK